MAEIYKASTPTITATLPNGVDLTNALKVYVSFAKGEKTFLTVKDPVVDGREVMVFLSQEETLAFPTGDVLMQLNWTYNDDEKVLRQPTNIGTIRVRRNLYDDVM